MAEGEEPMVEQPHLTNSLKGRFATLKHFAAWVALGLLMLLVLSWYGTYRVSQAAWQADQSKPKRSEIASAASGPAAKPAQKPAATPKTAPPASTSKVLIVSDVTFRRDPSSSSDAIRDLKKGEQLTLVGQLGPWYKVTDGSDVTGWVSASESFTKVIK